MIINKYYKSIINNDNKQLYHRYFSDNNNKLGAYCDNNSNNNFNEGIVRGEQANKQAGKQAGKQLSQYISLSSSVQYRNMRLSDCINAELAATIHLYRSLYICSYTYYIHMYIYVLHTT